MPKQIFLEHLLLQDLALSVLVLHKEQVYSEVEAVPPILCKGTRLSRQDHLLLEDRNHRMDRTIPRNLGVSSVHRVNPEASQQVVYSERQQEDSQVVVCLEVEEVVAASSLILLKISKTHPVRKIKPLPQPLELRLGRLD